MKTSRSKSPRRTVPSKGRSLLVVSCTVALLAAAIFSSAIGARPDRERERNSQNSRTSASTARAAATPATPQNAKSFESFRLVRSVNIFDPDRRPIVRDRGASNLSERSRGSGREVAYIGLTGTMVTADQQLAFFGGARAESRVVPVNEKISDYTLKGITSHSVEVERGGKTFTIPIGQRLALDGSGLSTLEAASAESESSGSAASTGSSSESSGSSTTSTESGAPASSSPPSVPGVAGDKAELIKRMMEKHARGE